jgi:hypothetical protein
MKIILIESPLHGKKEVFVDDINYDFLLQFTWCVVKDGNTFYAKRREELPKENGKRKRKNISMHREILNILNDGRYVVDHIDGNGLNNQVKNIRICTIAENGRNKTRKHSNSTSKYFGVCWSHQRGKWMAFLQFMGITNNIGFFENELDAALARDKKAIQLQGSFAKLNFPI